MQRGPGAGAGVAGAGEAQAGGEQEQKATAGAGSSGRGPSPHPLAVASPGPQRGSDALSPREDERSTRRPFSPTLPPPRAVQGEGPAPPEAVTPAPQPHAPTPGQTTSGIPGPAIL